MPTVCRAQCTDIFHARNSPVGRGNRIPYFIGEGTGRLLEARLIAESCWVVERQSWAWAPAVRASESSNAPVANLSCEHFLGAPKTRDHLLFRAPAHLCWKLGNDLVTGATFYPCVVFREENYQPALKELCPQTCLSAFASQLSTQESWPFS